MNSILFFRKAVAKLGKTKKGLSKTKKEQIIQSLPIPKDDFERARNQYICTMKRWTICQRIVMNAGALIMLLPYYLKMRLSKIEFRRKCDAIFYTDRISSSTIPNSLIRKFPSVINIPWGENMVLTVQDILFLKEIFKYKILSPYFILKTLLKLGMISYVFEAYNPSAIITYSEESFATSLLTLYCERRKSEYIGIMHGERLFELKITFFRCSKYFLWDEYYIRLFKKLGCEESQFIVEKPDAVLLPDYIRKSNPEYNYTFYLQSENKKMLKGIRKKYNEFVKAKKKVCLRPHPQWTDINLLNKIFPDAVIQNPKKVSLTKSLSLTEAAIGRCSTVLFQAYSVGIPVIIDDFSDPAEFCELEESEYILLKRPHLLLSEI